MSYVRKADKRLSGESAEMRRRVAALVAGEKVRDYLPSLMQTAPIAMISMDNTGNILLWNRMAEILFGYSAEAMLGKPVSVILVELVSGLSENIEQDLATALQTIVKEKLVETVGLRKNGNEFPIEISLAAWNMGNGAGFTAIICDITERKQAEARQTAAMELLQNVIDGVREPIMVIGTDYQVLFMNQAVRDNYSVGSAPVYCYQLSHNRETPCGGDGHPCPLDEVCQSLHPATVLHEHIRKDGRKHLVEILVSPLLDENGVLTGIVESARDITEHVQAEQALRESEHLYKALNAKNSEMAEQLRRQSTQRGELLKGLITAQEDERKRVARELHDELGQALSGLALQVGALESLIVVEPERAIEQLNAIRTLISQTTDQMYDLILALRPSALDDLGLAAALHACANRLLQKTGITFQLDASGLRGRLLPEIETALYRIFQEALNNVVRHAGAKQVQIVLSQRNGFFEGEIVDDGWGFDPRTVPQAGSKRGGLGLLGIQERVTQYGGQLVIISQPGEGTKLRIQIPLPGEGS